MKACSRHPQTLLWLAPSGHVWRHKLPACLSAQHPACLLVCLSVCPSVRLSVCPSVCPSHDCLSVPCLSAPLSVCLFVCLSCCLFVYVCVYLPDCLSVQTLLSTAERSRSPCEHQLQCLDIIQFTACPTIRETMMQRHASLAVPQSLPFSLCSRGPSLLNSMHTACMLFKNSMQAVLEQQLACLLFVMTQFRWSWFTFVWNDGVCINWSHLAIRPSVLTTIPPCLTL